MTPECVSSRALSGSVWRLLKKARTNAFQLNEETITDLVCLDFRAKLPGSIVTHLFSKAKESINGADWEWWFLDPKAQPKLVLRIQAKVLNFEKRSFQHLHYKKGAQNQALLDQCADDSRPPPLGAGVPHVGLYCLYAQWDMISEKPHMGMLRSCTCGASRRRQADWACTFLSAHQVLAMGKKKQLACVLPKAIPWHAVFCCLTGSRNSSLAHRVAENLTAHGLASPAMRSSVDMGESRRRSIPSYVREALLTGDSYFPTERSGPIEQVRGIIRESDADGLKSLKDKIEGKSGARPSRISIIIDDE